MGNPNWIKGGKSPNPEGRKRQSESGNAFPKRFDRWMKRNVTSQSLTKMFNALKPTEQVTFLSSLMPYVTPKKSSIEMAATIEVETIVGMQFIDTPVKTNAIQLPVSNEANKQQSDSINQTGNLKTAKEENYHSDSNGASQITVEGEGEVMHEQSDKPAVKPKIIDRVIKTGITWQEQERLDRERAQKMDQYNQMNSHLNDY